MHDMARARNIKPGFFTHDGIGELQPLSRLLFQALWCIADREGRVKDKPKWIKVQSLPYDECDVDDLLWELHEHGFIERYDVAGENIIQIVHFLKHQNPHPKETESELPPIENGGTLRSREITRKEISRCVPVLPLPSSPIPHPSSLILIPDCGNDGSADAQLTLQKPKTKAKENGKPKTRLGEFLQNSGGQPPIEWGEWAYREFGWDGNRLAFEWDSFATDFWLTDNCLSYAGGKKADWFATWRNHCRDKASQRNRGNGTGGKACSGFAAAFAASVAARYGISRAGSGFSGGDSTQGAGENAGAVTGRLPVGEIPY